MSFKLEDIGFYTLSNDRVKKASEKSPLMRCELILTDRCSFKCPYCRGLRDDLKGDVEYFNAVRTLDLWFQQGLQNIRFSGGEPTLYPRLVDLVRLCREHNVKRIAVSTNGIPELTKKTAGIKSRINTICPDGLLFEEIKDASYLVRVANSSQLG